MSSGQMLIIFWTGLKTFLLFFFVCKDILSNGKKKSIVFLWLKTFKVQIVNLRNPLMCSLLISFIFVCSKKVKKKVKKRKEN